MNDIGVIGLGNAGKPLALRLIDKGYRLRVYDLNPKAMDEVVSRGAAKGASPAEVVSDITLTVLPSSVEVRAASFGGTGVLATLKSGHTLIDLSGTDPGFMRALAAEAEKRGAGFLGATLHAAGAPAVTIPNGLLSIVVGGKNETLESALPLLKDMAQKIICVPEPWMPKALKIAVIMFAASSAVAAAEVSSWLAAQGLDPRLFHEMLKTTGSRASSGRMEDFLKRNNSHGGALSNSYKDIRQALATAAELGMPLPLMTAVSQMQEMGRALGFTRVNTPAAMGRLYEIITGQDLSAAVIEADKTPPQPRAPEVIYLK
ncbi:MAG TPA: NAD(P)-dependent oxidoreductase [Candidatus Binatia bacterium]|jgi:3-hydroxyisobutyrate dehydrogenase-like beta-hydroxyacid dehydrogenase